MHIPVITMFIVFGHHRSGHDYMKILGDLTVSRHPWPEANPYSSLPMVLFLTG